MIKCFNDKNVPLLAKERTGEVKNFTKNKKSVQKTGFIFGSFLVRAAARVFTNLRCPHHWVFVLGRPTGDRPPIGLSVSGPTGDPDEVEDEQKNEDSEQDR